MKHFLLGTALAALMGSSAMASDVGVSVSIGQPGFYGRIVLGNAPQPQVIYTAPVMVERPRVGYARQPIYLRVPPGHEKRWDRYCQRYNACGQPVYFVQQNWYNHVYAPSHRGYRDGPNFRAGPGYRGDPGYGPRRAPDRYDEPDRRGGHSDRGDRGDRGGPRGDRHDGHGNRGRDDDQRRHGRGND